MNGISSLYGGADMAKVMFGENARQVPAWLYVQDMGDGIVGLVGASRVGTGESHPLRYGSTRSHQLLVGEIIARPRLAVGTDALRGYGANGLLLGPHSEALADGDVIVGTELLLRKMREAGR